MSSDLSLVFFRQTDTHDLTLSLHTHQTLLLRGDSCTQNSIREEVRTEQKKERINAFFPAKERLSQESIKGLKLCTRAAGMQMSWLVQTKPVPLTPRASVFLLYEREREIISLFRLVFFVSTTYSHFPKRQVDIWNPFIPNYYFFLSFFYPSLNPDFSTAFFTSLSPFSSPHWLIPKTFHQFPFPVSHDQRQPGPIALILFTAPPLMSFFYQKFLSDSYSQFYCFQKLFPLR